MQILRNRVFHTFLLGFAYALGFRPNVLLPFFGLAAVGYFFNHLFKGEKQKEYLNHTFIFFMTFFCFSMYWVGYAFTTINMGHIGPFAVLALAFLLTCFHMPLGYVCYKVRQSHFLIKFFVYIFGFAACEWMRGNLFTGLPWNLAAHLWGLQAFGGGFFIPHQFNVGFWVMQNTYWLGLYGLSTLTLYIATGLMGALQFNYYTAKKERREVRVTCAFAFCVLISLVLYGGIRLHLNKPLYDTNAPFLRLVQPCINPHDKWSKNYLTQILQRQMDLSLMAQQDKIIAVIWPEAAVPLSLNLYPQITKELAKSVPLNGYLITGGINRINEDHYSATFVINHHGETKAIHHKAHLLPFGEYMPLKRFLPFDKFIQGVSDFTQGQGIKTMKVEGLPPFSALICYEAIFTNEVVEKETKLKPKWIVNTTNDAWYQDSVGLWQHLANVQFRAIEEKLPLVRVANSGITAVFDAYGRVTFQSQINQVGFFDIQLPLS